MACDCNGEGVWTRLKGKQKHTTQNPPPGTGRSPFRMPMRILYHGMTLPVRLSSEPSEETLFHIGGGLQLGFTLCAGPGTSKHTVTRLPACSTCSTCFWAFGGAESGGGFRNTRPSCGFLSTRIQVRGYPKTVEGVPPTLRRLPPQIGTLDKKIRVPGTWNRCFFCATRAAHTKI